MAVNAANRARAEAKARSVDRIRETAVALAAQRLAKMRDEILRDYARGGLNVRQIYAAAAADIGEILADASLVVHLRAYDAAVVESADYLARVASRALSAAPYVDRAVKYHKDRLSLDDAQVQALRTQYGDAAALILSPGMAEAEAETRALMASLIDRGVHVRQGRDEILSLLQSKGVEAASPWMAESIFRTQLQLAYSAGDYAADQDPAIASILWGYEYATVGDDRVRPNHAAMDGTKLPKNDAFWDTARPPNGHACRCVLLKIFDGEEDGVAYPGTVTLNDGSIVKGEPDPGFGFNPGRVYQDHLKPKRNPVAKRAEKAVEKREEAAAATGTGFPAAVDGLRVIRGAGGSTGAQIVEDESGNRFILKRGSSPEHLREEFQAEELYRTLGVPVPDSVLYETPGGPVKLSRFVEGRTLANVPRSEWDKYLPQIEKGFAADAFLANWDVAGMGLDNVLIGDDGIAYRIDTGGALRFRAQGGLKGDRFGAYPTELWSLLDRERNKDSATLFRELHSASNETKDRKWAMVEDLTAKRRDILSATKDADLRAILSSRLDELERQAAMYREFRADLWKGGYADSVVEHSAGLRVAGFHKTFSEKLNPTQAASWMSQSNRYTLQDEEGNEWDNLRGSPRSSSGVFWKYAEDNGFMDEVSLWADDQASSSWSDRAYIHKAFLITQRDEPFDKYFWAPKYDVNKLQIPTEESVADYYLKQTMGTKRQHSKAGMAALHAATYEMLSAIDMPNNDRANKRIALLRTEHKSVAKEYGLTRKGSSTLGFKRGIAESYSLVDPVSVKGDEITKQWIPHTRVLGGYQLSKFDSSRRYQRKGDAFFLNDRENEMIAIASDDIEVHHLGGYKKWWDGMKRYIETGEHDSYTKAVDAPPPEPKTGPAQRKGK